MKLPIPYEKAILIYEAFGQIKEKQPIPELILEFVTMEIEIFSKEDIQSNQPQIPHKWKILKVLYEILAMFSQARAFIFIPGFPFKIIRLKLPMKTQLKYLLWIIPKHKRS